MADKNSQLKNHAYVVIGGAGFIGSHFCRKILAHTEVENLIVIDNLSGGTLDHIADFRSDSRFEFVHFDIGVDSNLSQYVPKESTVIHLASNPDIAKAATEPTIDFTQGTLLSQEVAEAARLSKARQILYASGSGVYGDYGTEMLNEDSTNLRPVSTYGASKLAGEALFCAYAYMFDIPALAFRFGNVIGPHQTHGVGYDFVRKLRQNPNELSILGDGQQSKTYVHVSDVVNAVLLAELKSAKPFDVFNVGTDEYITVEEIAELVVDVMGLSSDPPKLDFTGGNRGWKGDVPVMRLNTSKIRALGWNNSFTTREALVDSVESMNVGEDSSKRTAGS